MRMKRFIEGESRTQSILLPASLEDYVADTNPVRVVDVFVDELDLGKLGFRGRRSSGNRSALLSPRSAPEDTVLR
jgi:transposase